jgi:hypothetical protein
VSSGHLKGRRYGETKRGSPSGTAYVLSAAGTENEQPTTEEVERRAYQIYLSRGGQDGHAVEDWLQAEQELQNPLI